MVMKEEVIIIADCMEDCNEGLITGVLQYRIVAARGDGVTNRSHCIAEQKDPQPRIQDDTEILGHSANTFVHYGQDFQSGKHFFSLRRFLSTLAILHESNLHE